MPAMRIAALADSPVSDAALEALLRESYVGGGFTSPALAPAMFAAEAVRSRGTVLVAFTNAGELLGTVTLVGPESPARRLAASDEREIHLLAVRPENRRGGIGAALMKDALDRAKASGARAAVLWTQPTMTDAQRLYERLGFRRDPGADFERAGRTFLVYRLVFDNEADDARSRVT